MAKKNRIFSSNKTFVSSYYSKLGQEERALRKAVDIMYKDQKILNPAPKLRGSTTSEYKKAISDMKELLKEGMEEDYARLRRARRENSETKTGEVARQRIQLAIDSTYGKERNKILKDLERAHELDKESDYDESEDLYSSLFGKADFLEQEMALDTIQQELDTGKRGGDTPF